MDVLLRPTKSTRLIIWCGLLLQATACPRSAHRDTVDAPNGPGSDARDIVLERDAPSPIEPVVESQPTKAPIAEVEAPDLPEPPPVVPAPPNEAPPVLEVPLEGFNPMVYVEPRSNVASPAPLVVVLHGNFDRPEWECDTWREEASKLGWLLCPRGYPRGDVDPSLDRWTYHGRGKLAVEITRGVEKLQEMYPGRISLDEAVLIGLSLGANMAPRLASMKILPFRALILVEGGYQVDDGIARSAARKGIERVVYVCGEHTPCPRRVGTLERIWKRAGVVPLSLIMAGAGHEYGSNFDATAREVLDFIDGVQPPASER